MERIRSILAVRAAVLAALTLTLAMGSCSQEIPIPTPGPSLRAGEVNIHFRVRTPGLVQTGSRAVDPEYTVSNIALLVFLQKDGTGPFLFQYAAEGQEIDQTDNTGADFKATLRTSNDPLRLLAIANYTDGLFDDIAPRSTEDAVREALTFSIPLGSIQPGIPMTGVEELTSLSAQTGAISIPMMRSLAKATVVTNLNADSPAFTATRVIVYRSNDSGQYFPDATVVDNEATAPVVTEVSMPSDAAPYNYTNTDPTEVCLLHENAVNSDPATATCIVVGGLFNGDTEETYYRIDFGAADDTDHPLGQVLRNTHYQFTIVEVKGLGWTDPDDAAENPATGISVNLIEWSDSATDIYFPGTNNSFTVSGRLTMVPYESEQRGTLVVTSTLPFTLDFPREGITLTSEEIDGVGDTPGMTVPGTLFTYFIRRTGEPDDSSPAISTYEIAANALYDNTSGTNQTEAIFTVGGGTLNVFFQQYSQPTAPTVRELNILSFGKGPGSLGDISGTGENTENLNGMLLNTAYFGPDSPLRLDKVNLMTTASDQFDQNADAANLASVLSKANVVILPSNLTTTPSPDCCAAIVEWLKDPTHTLIPIVETSGANAAIQSALAAYTGYTITWNSDPGLLTTVVNGLLGLLTNPNYNYGCAPDIYKSPNDGPILNAGDNFGAVNRGAGNAFVDSDGTYGYVSVIPPDVIPIINMAPRGSLLGLFASNHETNVMSLGVDFTHGIVWMGDSQWGSNSTGGMTSANPTAAPLNMIMGNLWAWIANRANPANPS